MHTHTKSRILIQLRSPIKKEVSLAFLIRIQQLRCSKIYITWQLSLYNKAFIKLPTSATIEIIIAIDYSEHNFAIYLHFRMTAWLGRSLKDHFAVFRQSYFCVDKANHITYFVFHVFVVHYIISCIIYFVLASAVAYRGLKAVGSYASRLSKIDLFIRTFAYGLFQPSLCTTLILVSFIMHNKQALFDIKNMG